jgi:hypothetical protein
MSWMRVSWVPACWMIVATCLLAGPARARPASLEALAKAVERAYGAHDLAAMEALVCWQDVDARTRAAFETAVAADRSLVVARVSAEPLDEGEVAPYVLDGVRYRPNVSPVARLDVRFAAEGQRGAVRRDETSFLAGRADDGYCIALAAPASDPATRAP